MRIALLFGATGLVGGQCLRLLLEDDRYDRILAFGRRPAATEHPKLEQRIIDFEQLDRHATEIRGTDLFYCLGTTLSQAGSRSAFWHVDYEYPVRIAEIAARNGVARWVMITSLGSSVYSPSFYLRTKGRCERAILQTGIPCVRFLRPSLLLGERSSSRPMEELAIRLTQAVAPCLRGPLKRLRPIDASVVARQMLDSHEETLKKICVDDRFQRE